MSNPRAEYSPIIDREPLYLPGGARLAIWVIINVEVWDFNAPMARSIIPYPQGKVVIPDVANYSWFDYGTRVGFWRLKEVLDRHGIRATMSLNATVCTDYPRIVEESQKSGWEFLAHSFTQRVMSLEDDERDVIRRTVKLIEKTTGQTPRGWMGPGLSETYDTPDILAEEGIEYVADWVNDDQPYPMKVKSGTLIAIPYTLEINDITIHLLQQHRSPELFERTRDQFDTLYREGADTARVMAIAVHPYVTGAPHRIKYFDQIFEYIKQHEGVLFLTGSEIVDWYKSAQN
jgi:allantoinase